MAEGKIVRKGGAGKQALAPTITEVSKIDTEIVFTITNNDAESAIILWEIGDNTPDENSVELAAGATSNNITVTGLTQETEYTVSATASVIGKVLSNVSSLAITTGVAIVYTAATGGTTLEYDSGGKRYKSHTFLSSGTFTVTQVGDATYGGSPVDRNQVDYLIIAGGGSGGGGSYGGGGGAGGYRTTDGTSGGGSSAQSKVALTTTSYGITIGAGGAIVTFNGNNGTNSSALGVTSIGGGAGGRGDNNVPNGGSGGGAAGSGTPGLGTTDEGFAGGGSFGGAAAAGGGGGAGGEGITVTTSLQGRDGGAGLSNTLRTGSAETRAGGGGGGGYSSRGFGSAGGGYGGKDRSAGSAATVNSGSGGGGGGSTDTTEYRQGQPGGSGIVVIRYEISPV